MATTGSATATERSRASWARWASSVGGMGYSVAPSAGPAPSRRRPKAELRDRFPSARAATSHSWDGSRSRTGRSRQAGPKAGGGKAGSRGVLAPALGFHRGGEEPHVGGGAGQGVHERD